jgi:pimeloyl-ACP methyl ester carboxylesterase
MAMSRAAPPDPPWLDRSAYPFRPHRVDLQAGRVHYVDEGAGTPALFVHGTPTWSFEWRHVIRALSPAHRCVAPDLLGFGLSERPVDFAYTPAAHARVLAELVDAITLDRFALVVHDYGGPTGLPLCLEHPERVSHLVLINTWMWSFAEDRDMARKARIASSALGRLLYRTLNFSPRVLLRQAWKQRRTLTPAVHRHYLAPFPDPGSRERVLWTLAREMLGSSAYYDGLWRRREQLRGRPILVLWGMADPAFTPAHLARWREVLGESARIVELPGVGHWPQEEQPEAVVRELGGFLGGRAT